MKYIQVFTKKSEGVCEIDAQLLKMNIHDEVVVIRTKEENGSNWTHIFPLTEIEMLRISEE